MSRTSFTKVYSRKPTQCRESDSKRSQNACGNFIENRKPTSCCTLEKNKNRLGGGGNDRSIPNGGCCSTSKSYNSSPCSVKSTKPLPAPSSPSPCSHKRQQSAYQRHEPSSHRSPERCPSVKGNCPCSGFGGQAGHDNPERQTDNGCGGSSKSKGLSCKCICQSCKSSQVQGGCGGQSCGKMYSCAGSSGGKSCFPRNTQRRSGGECCGGTNSSNHDSCC